METAFWEELNTNNFNVFIRDLSSSMNTNLKHMIEDFDKDKDKDKIKPKKMKKKDLIIIEQNKKRYKKSIDEDNNLIDFLLKNINDDNPYENFEKLKTNEGRLEYKFRLLERYWKKKYVKHIFVLYYHLINEIEISNISENRKNLLKKINKTLNKYDSKLFMLSDLGDLLPPLNFWDKGPLKLDEWQENVIRMVKNKESVIVRAPTSSGKTFIAMSTGILHNKILYVCPAKPVAYQVGSHFIKMGYKVHFLIDGIAHNSYNEKTNIFIGIPETIEKYLYKIGTHFNYAVFDEIHNLNNSYENIIRLLDCNFLALSATIENKEYLKSKLNEYYPNNSIKYIEYNTRFINHQRWIFSDNNLNKIHPITCLNSNDFDKFNNISFTPNDCSVLYEKLADEFEDTELEDYIDDLSPDNYFKENKLLTLEDNRTYEKLLKDTLHAINKKYPSKISNIINYFSVELKENNLRFSKFFTKCKIKNLLPMIVFHTEEDIAKEIFYKIDNELKTGEKEEYPFHYEILEKKKEYYDKYLEYRKDYSSRIKIKTKDAFTEKREKMIEYDKREKDKFITNISNFYNACMNKCKNEKQKQNLNKELNNFLKYPDFRNIDPFMKHKDFCFTPQEPMSGDEIRTIKREIKRNTGKTIEYEDPLFQLLKRGIGIYIKSMPEEYNWIVQRLLTEKKLGIVISDKTLCMGIDLPIRSVCFTGYKNPKFTKEDYLQMGGRAGRRGKDTQGNIIFQDIKNYKELMLGELPQLAFKENKLISSYNSLARLNKKINLSGLDIEDSKIHNNPKLDKLLWYLKDYEKSFEFVSYIQKYEKQLFLTNERDREYTLFNHIKENLCNLEGDLLSDYKFNKMNKEIYEIGCVCKDIINSLHPMAFKIIVDTSNKIFSKIKYQL